MRLSRFATGLVATLAVTACAGHPPAGPGPFGDAPVMDPVDGDVRSPDTVDRAEIQERGGNDHTARRLINRLRPAWLRARGQNSFDDPRAAYPIVYIDEIRHGGLDRLDEIPSSEILSMHFFNAADATTRWGTGHPAGVINIVTGR